MGSFSGSWRPTVKYHYSDRFSTYSVMRGRVPLRKGSVSCFSFRSGNGVPTSPSRPVPRTESDWEFDWGGTSVKR